MTGADPRVVVVTGAGAGLGRAIAREFGERGYRMGLIGRDRARLDAAVDEIETCGGHAVALPADVADDEAVEHAAAAVEDSLGPIDVWVNNAMTSVLAPFREISPAEFRRVTEVTYLGYVNGTRAALEHMVARDRGVIVQVGSALSYRAIPLQSAYCGAKHAIRGFSQSVRCELLHQGSHVAIVNVHLPALNTPQFDWVLCRVGKRPRPVAPVYQPEIAARAVVHVAEHPRRELWVGWSTTRSVLGTQVVPGLIDRYLGRVGVRAQQTDEPEDQCRPSNLYVAVDGDYQAHGSFDADAIAHSPAMWASIHRRELLAFATVASASAAMTLRRRAR